ncbi:molybdate ABC transporter substrate-binding protein, partial [Acinetobacter variabilis]|uniref:molybdate ABC transporter substrate-binding protein n=1 Tax=Acinetobacter variabilis TaxID=70346 RepID=UPI002FDA426F
TAKDNTNIKDCSDLTSDSVKKVALGETKSVPVGQYSEEALKKLGIFDKIQGKTVYAKDVKEVLAWVETGNADVGMVYATDAKVSDKVKVVKEAEEGSYTKAIYPVAVLKDSKNVDAAKAFVDFISSDSGKAIFEKYGTKSVIWLSYFYIKILYIG